MCVAQISGMKDLGSGLRKSTARAGFESWRSCGPQDSLVSRGKRFEWPEQAAEEAPGIAKARSVSLGCITCEGAALCGIAF